ncbi:MAG: glycosyltransferase [Candidatus Rokubacteria bacterium]|nr:glycosyltransferase [Candidatus Rokubacteria bacterium]
MMRVLHVITRLTLGGSAENTIASMVALERAGYRGVLAVGLRQSDAVVVDDARRRGVTIVDVPGFCREISPIDDLAALRQIVALIHRERPAIVHTHTSKAGFTGRLAARIARVPAVIHQPHGHIFYGYWGAARTKCFIALERLAARWTDRMITLTERGRDEHLALGIGTYPQYRVVPSGVPTAAIRDAAPSRAAARARLGLDANAFVVVGVGRLVPVKGFDLVVAALPRLIAARRDACVVLVGDGPERQAIEAQAKALGVAAHLRLPGAVDDVVPYLAAADVLTAPSRNEGMGRAIVEAMALGVPVVAASVGGIPDVVDSDCGRLVPAGDAAKLGDALAELAGPPMLRAKLADAARRRAEAFSDDVAAAKMREVYDALVDAKGLR